VREDRLWITSIVRVEILYSARTSSEYLALELELDALRILRNYLAKPFHFPELVLRVRALARRRPTAQPRIVRAAGIELDPLHHTAARDGRRLDLSAKEFAVLEVLMRTQHAVVSAEDLFSQVWDENVDPFSNTVRVTISRLGRNSENPPPSKPSPTSDTASHNPRVHMKPSAVR
jgi:DNA-binding response OmpR family regulator